MLKRTDMLLHKHHAVHWKKNKWGRLPMPNTLPFKYAWKFKKEKQKINEGLYNIKLGLVLKTGDYKSFYLTSKRS